MLGYSLLAGGIDPTVLIIAAAALGLIAFVIGFTRGFRSTGWGGFIWGLISVLWIFFEKKLHDKNPLASMKINGLSQSVVDMIAALSSLLVIVLVVFALFGILAAAVRPKKANIILQQYYLHEQKEIRVEGGEAEEYEDEKEEKKNKGFDKPFKVSRPPKHFVDRLCGGLIALVNFLFVCVGLAAVALVLMPVFKVDVSSVYESGIMQKLEKDIAAHAIDLLIVAILAGMAYGGWCTGLISGLRNVFLSVGMFAAVVGGFAFGFLKVDLALNMNDFFFDVYDKLIKDGSMVDGFIPLFAKLSTGAVTALLLALIVALIGQLMKVLARLTRRSGPFRFIDGTFGLITMFILGFLLVAFIVFLFYMLYYFGLDLKLGGVYTEDSFLTKGFVDLMEDKLRPFLDGLREVKQA